ncbi:hypothetical protein R0137_06505 [Congregibacter brevis]|uniref:YHYH domain-containing protein n=1 Tax=Congregibacter brevis TaxID=3081201 RepID=A0ABZ0IHP1_9GAMM|nr:hypothetical protein R0137_06505 [Congregibacter sp. IMCC45268]
MSKSKVHIVLVLGFSTLAACGGGGGTSGAEITADTPTDAATNTPDTPDTPTVASCDTGLPDAYLYFGSNVEIALSSDGCNVILKTDGLPNHVSTYWTEGYPLYEAPTEAQAARMTGNRLEESDANDVTVSLPVKPEKAPSSTGTSLGIVGYAVSGSYVFNQYEGGNTVVGGGVAQGLDNDGAHIGPSVYHYHLEPKASISNDDDSLIGVIADGFFLFGRRCWALGGETAATAGQLDASGGHVTQTQYSNGIEEYHYHIFEEAAGLEGMHYLFPGDYQGTPVEGS